MESYINFKEVIGMSKQTMMTIISNTKLTHDVYEMVLEGNIQGVVTHPGQFINIKLDDGETTYLRRPMSIHDYDDHHITMAYKVVGIGTNKMKSMQVDEKLDVLVGLGNGFTLENIQKALIIGGGVGVPPMYNLAKQYVEAGVEVEIVLGFNSKDDVFYEDKFSKLGKTHICTMDGSYGMQGNVVDVIQQLNISYDKYYACGPEKMLDALVLFDNDNGYLSFEARMGCGFGACMGCSCKVKTAPYKRICVEGPVLKSSEVIVNE